MSSLVNAPVSVRAEEQVLRRRRTLFGGLCCTTGVVLVSWLALILGADGLSVVDALMLTCFLLTLPWTLIGLWNAIIGLGLLSLSRDPIRRVVPLHWPSGAKPPEHATAIVMPVYNEDPDMVIRHLEATLDDLAASGTIDAFEAFLLSDSQDQEIAAQEERLFAAFAARSPYADRLHYRRRHANTGFKTGNLWEWLDRDGHRFAHMIVLDADSVMSGNAILRLVRLMEANPRLGILQTLVTGLPTLSAFARIFQFGMRHGMRTYTTGSAWWQGPAGPYWGHNAIIRVDAFRQHCRLPELSGRPPWGGLILSHDQVEAAMMRRAGYDVRVLPDEDGSYELNPPCLAEFVRRDLRWCQGNLQYLGLIGQPDWHPMGRLQLALAILMYVAPVAWLSFMVLGFTQGVLNVDGGHLWANPWGATASGSAVVFLALMVSMAFAPKVAGLVDALMDGKRRRSYGGATNILSAGGLEIVFSIILSPIVAAIETAFIIRLISGRGLTWRAQERSERGMSWSEAWTRFWAPSLLGLVVLVVFAWNAPGVLPWVLPVAGGMLLAVPFAWFTAQRWFGRRLATAGFAMIPEEHRAATVVRRAVPWLAARERLVQGADDAIAAGAGGRATSAT